MFSRYILWDFAIILYFYKKKDMKLYEKIRTIREEKKLSQDAVAHELGLCQSQYSRREKGEIKFDADEILRLSKVLNATVSELYEEEINVFNNSNQKDGVFEQFVTILNKLIEQYEKRLQAKDDMIALLKKQNSPTKCVITKNETV